jgi:lipopolysaccharide biosynthesis glycosyltransferase
MNPLPVFLASNDAYACFAATMMMSIAEHTSATVHFHLFADDISPARRTKLARAIERYRHVSLELHGDLERKLDAHLTSWYPTRAIFSRYFIADLFPAYDLCLYADVDTIFEVDIAELFARGVGDHGIAGCHDMGLHTVVDVTAHKDRLGIPQEHDYFNNGLLLIDAAYWRRNRVAEELTRIAQERKGMVTFPSQDPMNIFFSPNRYLRLPQRFNFMPSFGSTASEPTVNHYTWPKPWNDPATPRADAFLEIARRSPFAREIWWKRYQWRFGKPGRAFRHILTQRKRHSSANTRSSN